MGRRESEVIRGTRKETEEHLQRVIQRKKWGVRERNDVPKYNPK